MNILIINGSPRKKGLIAQMLGIMREEAEKHGDKIEMVYTNTGKKPLILDNVTTNCDCTEVDWSKKPVMPGKTGVIKVTYTAKHTGLISKWVTVMSNAETDRVVLKTSGEVK